MKTRTTKGKAKVSKKKAARPPAKKAAARPRKTRPTPPSEPKATPPEPRRPVAATAPAPSPTPPRPQPPAPAALSLERRAALVEARRRQFQHYRDLLLDKQRELTEAYTISRGDSRGNLDDGTEDYIDYAVHSYAREFLLSLTELDRKQLLQVEDALRRIDRGEYGRCLQCGEDINPRRLEVAPWARYCVKCQELEERGLLPQPTAASEEEREEPEEVEEEAVPAEEGVFEEELETEEEEVEEPALVGEEGLPVATEDDEEE